MRPFVRPGACVALAALAVALVVGAPAARADQSLATLAAGMAGRWTLAPPGSAPGPRGVVTFRVVQKRLAGTFTRPGGNPVPLHGTRLRFERLTFTYAPGPGARPVQADLRPTLDADAWTGRLSPGGVLVDLTRVR